MTLKLILMMFPHSHATSSHLRCKKSQMVFLFCDAISYRQVKKWKFVNLIICRRKNVKQHLPICQYQSNNQIVTKNQRVSQLIQANPNRLKLLSTEKINHLFFTVFYGHFRKRLASANGETRYLNLPYYYYKLVLTVDNNIDGINNCTDKLF